MGWMLIGPVTVELATIESGNHFKRGILRTSKLHITEFQIQVMSVKVLEYTVSVNEFNLDQEKKKKKETNDIKLMNNCFINLLLKKDARWTEAHWRRTPCWVEGLNVWL